MVSSLLLLRHCDLSCHTNLELFHTDTSPAIALPLFRLVYYTSYWHEKTVEGQLWR